ncbi:MAG TPA: hypothetical protein VGM50_10390 [Gemmatimonadaceae bacterium]
MRIRKRYLQNAKVLVATAPVLVAGAGCYEYQQASQTALRPGLAVHVELTTSGTTSLAQTIGPNAAGIDGKVISTDASSLRLAATQIVRTVGPEEFLRNEPIAIPASGVGPVTVRQLDRPRTFIATALILGGVVLAQIVANQAGLFSSKSAPPASTK